MKGIIWSIMFSFQSLNFVDNFLFDFPSLVIENSAND